MNESSKAPIILAIIGFLLFVISTGAAIYLWSYGQNVEAARAELATRNETLEAGIVSAEKRVDDLETDLQEATEKLAEMEAEEPPTLTLHTEPDYTIQVMEGYKVIPPTDSTKWLVIKNSDETGEIEIWNAGDFPDGRPIGFSGEETPEEVDYYFPKLDGDIRSGKSPERRVRVRYRAGDTQTAQELYDMLATYRPAPLGDY